MTNPVRPGTGCLHKGPEDHCGVDLCPIQASKPTGPPSGPTGPDRPTCRGSASAGWAGAPSKHEDINLPKGEPPNQAQGQHHARQRGILVHGQVSLLLREHLQLPHELSQEARHRGQLHLAPRAVRSGCRQRNDEGSQQGRALGLFRDKMEEYGVYFFDTKYCD